jgi:hypothetical protein
MPTRTSCQLRPPSTRQTKGARQTAKLGHSPPSTQELSSRETRSRCRKVLSSSSSSAEDEHDDVMEEVDSDEGVTSEAEETEGEGGSSLKRTESRTHRYKLVGKGLLKGTHLQHPRRFGKMLPYLVVLSFP